MSERDPDTIYMGHSDRPYCRVEVLEGLGGRFGNGIAIVPLEGAKPGNQLGFTDSGALQLERILKRKRLADRDRRRQ